MDSESSNFTGRENVTSSSASGNGSGDGDASNFECNICFELAQDPIITLCGHLFCWPCLFRWLRLHSHSHECPVCKALIQEEKLVPLYGRGGTPSDPRSKPVPGVEIPNRPRPQPQPQPQRNPFPQESLNMNPDFGPNLWGGLWPAFSSFAVLTGIGGMIPAIFSVQAVYNFGGPPGYQNGRYYNAAANQHHHHHHQQQQQQQQQQEQQEQQEQGVQADTPGEQDNKLRVIILFVILAAALSLLY